MRHANGFYGQTDHLVGAISNVSDECTPLMLNRLLRPSDGLLSDALKRCNVCIVVFETMDACQAIFLPFGASASLLLMFYFFESLQLLFTLCTGGKDSAPKKR